MKKLSSFLTIMIISLPLFLLASCSNKNKAETPQEPPSKALEFTAPVRSVKSNVYFADENVGGLNEDIVLGKIRNFAASTDIEPVDASIDSITWKLNDSTAGKRVNVEGTLEALLNAAEGERVLPLVDEIQLSVTSQSLAENITVIGKYTTPILDRASSRVNNIELAAQKINRHILLPGEIFSFNKVLGRRTQVKGYGGAPVIINTKDGPKKGTGVGGGICQVSTTLYNAIEECGIEILERHLHSKDVGYVPKGQDATICYGTADLKFRNNRQYPIMIRVYVKRKALTVNIIENRNIR